MVFLNSLLKGPPNNPGNKNPPAILYSSVVWKLRGTETMTLKKQHNFAYLFLVAEHVVAVATCL